MPGISRVLFSFPKIINLSVSRNAIFFLFQEIKSCATEFEKEVHQSRKKTRHEIYIGWLREVVSVYECKSRMKECGPRQ